MLKRLFLILLCLPLAWYAGKETYRLGRQFFQGSGSAEETLRKDLQQFNADVKSKWTLRPTIIAGVNLEAKIPDEGGSESEAALASALTEYDTKFDETRALLRTGKSGNQKLDGEVKKLLAQQPLTDNMDGKIERLCADIGKALVIPIPDAKKTKIDWDTKLASLPQLRKDNGALSETYFKHRAERNDQLLKHCEKLLGTLKAAAADGVKDVYFSQLEALVKEADDKKKDHLIVPLARQAALRWMAGSLPEPKYEDEAWIHNGTRWERRKLEDLKAWPSWDRLSEVEELQFENANEGGKIVKWWARGVGDVDKLCPTPKSLLAYVYKKVRARESMNFNTLSQFISLMEKEYSTKFGAKHAHYAKTDKDAPVHGWKSLREEPYLEFWLPLARFGEITTKHAILCRDVP